MWLHINRQSPIEVLLKPNVLSLDKYLTIGTSENKSIKSQTKKSFITGTGKFTKYQMAFSKTTETVILKCSKLKKRKKRVEKF